jgi:hypothetical protein
MAAAALPGFDVPPPVTDDDTVDKRHVPQVGGVGQHARTGLPALAVVDVIVKAGDDGVDLDPIAELSIDGVDIGDRRGATRDIRLVGHHHYEHSRSPERSACFCGAIEHLDILRSFHRMRSSFSNAGPDKHSVPVKKGRASDRTSRL